jgi:hypothetical protein
LAIEEFRRKGEKKGNLLFAGGILITWKGNTIEVARTIRTRGGQGVDKGWTMGGQWADKRLKPLVKIAR